MRPRRLPDAPMPPSAAATAAVPAWPFALLFLALALALPRPAAAQREFREYPSFEGRNGMTALPPDYDQPAEFVVGRLMYPGGGRSWAVDYPKGDRTLASLLRRFTRLDVRSVEQPVDPDDEGDIYYWPFLIAGLAGNWRLNDEQAATLREYLLRGGFIYFDSFFGSGDWLGFEIGLKQIFPDRRIIEIPEHHPVLNIVYDVSELKHVQIPHFQSLLGGGGGWLSDGREPQWLGIEDDAGRLMVLIGFNNDTPDAWQWADEPRYPAEAANLGLRIGVNIATYLMTH
jgi:hypothetical protein